MKDKIIYPELSYRITGVLYKAHNQVGNFGSEKQYGDVVERMLKSCNIQYKRECRLDSIHDEEMPGNHRVDFIIEDSIVLEIKAKRIITREDYNQVQRYIRSANKKLGILVNFHNRHLAPKRILNSSYRP